MVQSPSSRILRAALFTLVPCAYLSMRFWQPVDRAGLPFYSTGLQWLCIALMAAVFLASLMSWRTYRLVSIFGFLACFLWLTAFLLPVL